MSALRIACFVVSVCIAFAASVANAEARRPNIVLIVSDDQRPDTIAALGNAQIRTPALDALFRRGVSFRRAVCAYPICVASRAEMLTGCTTFRALQPYPYGKLNPSLPTLPAVLQQAGYRTFHVGKWHISGRPLDHGYTASRGLFAAGGSSAPPTVPLDRFGQPNTGYRGWVFQDDDGTKHLERGVGLTPHTDVQIADAAIELIREANGADVAAQPFFLHVNFTAPHDPRLAVPRRGPVPEVSLPLNFRPDHPFDHGNAGGRDELLLPRPLTEAMIRDELNLYYGLIEHLDAQIDRIIRALQDAGRIDDTIIVFTSDHGLALGSHGLLGKQNQYEHTIGVPLIMAGPGLRTGIAIQGQCYLRDLFPTLCEWAGAKPPADLDARSLGPLLTGGAEELYPEVIGYFTDTQRMLRTARWKYIRYAKANREQLFNLEADPLELRDQFDAAPPRILADLRTRLDARLNEYSNASGK